MYQFSEGCQCHTLSQALTKGTPCGGKATWQIKSVTENYFDRFGEKKSRLQKKIATFEKNKF